MNSKWSTILLALVQSADGILGYEFLKKYKATLNMAHYLIELTSPTDNEAYEQKSKKKKQALL